MDFFEALKARTIGIMHSGAWAARYRKEVREHGADKSDVLVHLAIDAGNEALKEMTVREPIRGKIWHCDEDALEFTRFVDEEFDELIIAMDHIGADGEEVVVMVFKKP